MGMVGAKIGTKTWSEAPQNEIVRSTGVNNRSASDNANLNGEDIGSVLNKIADPNYVDPAKKIRTVGNDKMDKDAFMKLMLAQMKNQDPTNPMKSHEMAAQLAQFSSVEQMQNINSTLNEMKAGQKPAENFQALNFIGKAVAGDSSHISRMKGDHDHDFNFDLPDNAKTVTIKVRNAEGEVVKALEFHDLKKGMNKITWNGRDERGASMPVGEYQIFTEATNGAQKKLAVKTDFNGIITGINYSSEGPVLLVGNQSVKLKDVKKIIDPNVQANINTPAGAEAAKDVKAVPAMPSADPKSAPAVPEPVSFEDAGAPDKEVSKGPVNNLENISMTHDMATKLQKSIAPPSTPPVMERSKSLAKAPTPPQPGAKGI